MKPKVLVASPIYNKMEYCLSSFLESLKNIDYESFDILLVDNSKTSEFFNKLKKIEGILVIKDTTQEKENLRRLVSSRNLILDYASNNNYNYVLMMDSDVIAPRNIIKKLIEDKKDIVSGLYYNYFNSKLLPVAYLYFTEEQFAELKPQLPANLTRFDIRRQMTIEEANSNKLIEVLYPSAGCMLVSKSVFSSAKYGIIDAGITTSDDIYFINEALKKGFKTFVDTGVKCKHLTEGKFEQDNEGNLTHPMYKNN